MFPSSGEICAVEHNQWIQPLSPLSELVPSEDGAGGHSPKRYFKLENKMADNVQNCDYYIKASLSKPTDVIVKILLSKIMIFQVNLTCVHKRSYSIKFSDMLYDDNDLLHKNHNLIASENGMELYILWAV
jgi:hypothetical protein